MLYRIASLFLSHFHHLCTAGPAVSGFADSNCLHCLSWFSTSPPGFKPLSLTYNRCQPIPPVSSPTFNCIFECHITFSSLRHHFQRFRVATMHCLHGNDTEGRGLASIGLRHTGRGPMRSLYILYLMLQQPRPHRLNASRLAMAKHLQQVMTL